MQHKYRLVVLASALISGGGQTILYPAPPSKVGGMAPPPFRHHCIFNTFGTQKGKLNEILVEIPHRYTLGEIFFPCASPCDDVGNCWVCIYLLVSCRVNVVSLTWTSVAPPGRHSPAHQRPLVATSGTDPRQQASSARNKASVSEDQYLHKKWDFTG